MDQEHSLEAIHPEKRWQRHLRASLYAVALVFSLFAYRGGTMGGAIALSPTPSSFPLARFLPTCNTPSPANSCSILARTLAVKQQESP